jgi:hypothetical protein
MNCRLPCRFSLDRLAFFEEVFGATVVEPLERAQRRRPDLRNLPGQRQRSGTRRRSRFFAFGHTPGWMREPVVELSREHPRTLDPRLRSCGSAHDH